ncbi:hypothetical protein BX666DRAFT_1372868, partial [Dichotomocladium elegans]
RPFTLEGPTTPSLISYFSLSQTHALLPFRRSLSLFLSLFIKITTPCSNSSSPTGRKSEQTSNPSSYHLTRNNIFNHAFLLRPQQTLRDQHLGIHGHRPAQPCQTGRQTNSPSPSRTTMYPFPALSRTKRTRPCPPPPLPRLLLLLLLPPPCPTEIHQHDLHSYRYLTLYQIPIASSITSSSHSISFHHSLPFSPICIYVLRLSSIL